VTPPIPLLIFSDAISAPSGLARITRDLASRIANNMPGVFKVATIGYGGSGSSRFPFTQYSWTRNDEWIIHDLEDVWHDLAGDRKGIFLSIQDASRMLWFARPETCSDARVRRFLESKPFKKWGYFPIDATGPNNRLSLVLGECIRGYDRVLCYSEWARKIVENTLGKEDSEERDLDQLPHGIDTTVFYPRPRARQREMFGRMAVGKSVSIPDDELLVGIVATNQARKDYGLGIAACAELSKTRKVRVWVHTDVLDRHWSIPYLLGDFGLSGGNLISLGQFTDDVMAKLYSACDVTLGIGAGEGYGFPIFESLACGTPCIHGNYGGASEHLDPAFVVASENHRYEGIYGCLRPVFNPASVARNVNFVMEQKCKAELPVGLDWNNLWPRWEQWLRKGIA
jgi:glycosyltransferase involved in cell wall biosynthesis